MQVKPGTSLLSWLLLCHFNAPLRLDCHNTSSVASDVESVYMTSVSDICVKAGWVGCTDADGCVSPDNVCITGADSCSDVKSDGEDNAKAEDGEDDKVDGCDKAEGDNAIVVLGYGRGVKFAGIDAVTFADWCCGDGSGTVSMDTGMRCRSPGVLAAMTIMALIASS